MDAITTAIAACTVHGTAAPADSSAARLARYAHGGTRTIG
jgi:hypothetical protein